VLAIKSKTWRVIALSLLLTFAAAIWLQVGIEASLIPATQDICHKNEYTNQKECTTYDLHPFIVIKVLQFFDTQVLTSLATILLVIVTWMLVSATKRLAEIAGQQDISAKRQERAYLVAGPFLGIPHESTFDSKLTEWVRDHRAEASMFHGPWQMAVYNFGRTAAFSTRIEWGVCPPEDFDVNVPVSTYLDDTHWCSRHRRPLIETENIYSPGVRHHVWQVEIPSRDDVVGYIHFGRITYQDVFGDVHWTTFAYCIGPEHSSALPKSLTRGHGDGDPYEERKK
jgi:hypothetical protein